MRTTAGILSLSAVGLALLLSSCQYTNDPNKEWKDKALEAYKAFYAKEENQAECNSHKNYPPFETEHYNHTS